MSDWLIRQRYGFGAARVRLAAAPLRTNAVQWTLREGAGSAIRELRENGSSGLLGLAPALAFGFVVLIAPAIAMLPLGSDQLELDLVLLETARLEPPAAALPLPAARPEPLPVPAPAPKPIVPEPPPPKVAKPPPPPPAAAVPKPAPPKPAPPPPRTAPRPLPAPIAVAEAPVERAPESLRAPRTARAEPARPTLRVDPLASTPEAPQPEFSPVRTRHTSVRVAAAAAPRPVARIDALAPPSATAPPAAPSRRSARARPARAPQRDVRASALSLPGLANEPAPAKPIALAKAPARRPPAPAAPTAAGRQRTDSPALAGVPLAALASCVSDREEDRLKQQVLAAVGPRAECASAAGRYVFVETRNLNAFLMTVKRAPTRKSADRCIELSLALDCLKQSRNKETGRL